ncbi:phosphatase PAP2 family protein [Anaerosporobacter faecicola]|uniref:phosphatase PAP2 family protein n=1 Tax=Anaerosporobacter faecicola TaxID=2718714 RepID=UPI001439CE25|nr:phosphatase PAP2 family protein [Anaerosporobacter faecicola]
MEFLKLLESIRTPWLTWFFLVFTSFGEETLVLAIICFLYWCHNKRLAYRICFSFFSSGLVVQTLKITFRIPRPWVKDSSFHAVSQAVPTATGYSFPSGHTQCATALYSTFAWNTKKKRLQILCFVIIAGVMISRMYLGVHTPQDVLTSFFITCIFSYVTNYLINRFRLLDNNLFMTAIFLVTISIGVAIYSLVLLHNGTIETRYASDCCKAAGAGIGFAIGWFIESTYIRFSERATAPSKQVIKFLIGIGITVLLKVGLKAIFGSSIPSDFIRYSMLVLWITVGFPYLLKHYESKLLTE